MTTNRMSSRAALSILAGMLAACTAVASDGTGPGTYTSLADVFRDHAGVWLELPRSFGPLLRQAGPPRRTERVNENETGRRRI